MFKKMLPWLIMILIAITLITVAAFILWDFIMKESDPTDANAKAQELAESVDPKPLTAKERMDLSFHIEDVTNNLSDIDYVVKVSFSFLLDNQLVKAEMEQAKPWILDIIGNILSDTNPNEITGSRGRDVLKAKLINQINPILHEGKLLEVSISDLIISSR